jgi:urease accessory protein
MPGRAEGGPVASSASESDLADLCDLAEALAGSRERHMETMLQGAAFLKAASAWPHPSLAALPPDCAYPVAVGAVAGAHGIDLRSALAAFLHAFASNQIQAAIRLSVIGQVDAMATLASLEALIGQAAVQAAQSSLDDLGSATMMAEIAAMQHEAHYSRLFRT